MEPEDYCGICDCIHECERAQMGCFYARDELFLLMGEAQEVELESMTMSACVEDQPTPKEIADKFVDDVVRNNSTERAKEIRQETFKAFEEKL